MTQSLQLLLLDFDGVLASYARELRCRSLAAHAGCAPSTVAAALFDSGLESAYDSGMIATGDYLATLGGHLGAVVDEETWIAARVDACRADPQIIEMVLAAAARLPVAVLTNNGPLMARAIQRIVPALFPMLDGRVLCSGALGGRKPQRQVYDAALRQLGAPPAATLFIDDLFVNVRGARAAGLHADTVKDARSMRRVLRRYGVL